MVRASGMEAKGRTEFTATEQKGFRREEDGYMSKISLTQAIFFVERRAMAIAKGVAGAKGQEGQ